MRNAVDACYWVGALIGAAVLVAIAFSNDVPFFPNILIAAGIGALLGCLAGAILALVLVLLSGDAGAWIRCAGVAVVVAICIGVWKAWEWYTTQRALPSAASGVAEATSPNALASVVIGLIGVAGIAWQAYMILKKDQERSYPKRMVV